jgi:serine/threonine protein kinase
MANGESLALSRAFRGMTATRWKQIETVFEQALDLGTEERLAFLEQACNGDEELRREVESLLDAHAQAGSFIDNRSQFYHELDANEPAAPQTIGHYRIVRELGRGGMGAVYLAERADEYEKRVAIKLIKRGMDTDSVLRRFRNERQILAGFDHTNIARLFDGGTTEDGLPYFVMEYIEGLPIDEYCNKRALSIPERLKLFREVCAAVSYAHRHLVVHRDLKRSNILVTHEGVPKLLDFGIAKILQPENEPLLTITSQRLLTPEYASPEQFLGQPVTTASDVYSLGVILYELLTGQFPYRFASQAPRDIEHAITTAEPEKPSTAVARHRTSPSDRRTRSPSSIADRSLIQNRKLLRGDLDNIVLMALRKEPERRYQSVEQFSEDIRRHLEARPIFARKDTAGYRAGKFVRRNKIALAAATLIFLSLLGGIIATTFEAYRTRQQKALAERRFNDVRKLAHSVLFDYHDAIKNLPGSTKVRERLVKDALVYLDSLANDAQGDPALQLELAEAYSRVGDVRGGREAGDLGDSAGALESYTKSLLISEAVVAANPSDIEAQRDVAFIHQKVGLALQQRGEVQTGLEHFQRSRALYYGMTQEHPDREDIKLGFASSCNTLAHALETRGDVANALAEYRAAMAIIGEIVRSHPEVPLYRRLLWYSHDGVGNTLFSQQDVPGALAANHEEIALAEALIEENPVNTDYRRVLMIGYYKGGQYRDPTDKRGALENFGRALKLAEESAAADPANALTRQDLAETQRRVADLSASLDDNAQALSHFRNAAENYERLPSDTNARLNSAICRAGAARIQARLGQIAPALNECPKVFALFREISTPSRDLAEAYEYLGHVHQTLAASPKISASEKREQMSTARDMFQQALNVLNAWRKQHMFSPDEESYVRNLTDEMTKCETVLDNATVAPPGK